LLVAKWSFASIFSRRHERKNTVDQNTRRHSVMKTCDAQASPRGITVTCCVVFFLRSHSSHRLTPFCQLLQCVSWWLFSRQFPLLSTHRVTESVFVSMGECPSSDTNLLVHTERCPCFSMAYTDAVFHWELQSIGGSCRRSCSSLVPPLWPKFDGSRRCKIFALDPLVCSPFFPFILVVSLFS
jgi:hypothetical protein